MQYHHHGYVSGAPGLQPAAGVGLDRPDDLPDEVDVLIVGAGPAGHIAAAQLAQFPGVVTRLIERAPGRLERGRADGVQARTVETFQAFGFATRIAEEAYRLTATAFWGPDPHNPGEIVRVGLHADDATGISEFPHIVINQARVQDYFAEVMAQAPTRMRPDYGIELVDLEVSDDAPGGHRVGVRVRHGVGARAGEVRTLRARYVIGADGARSRVRACIGRTLDGEQAMHAWGVIDVLAVTDFPDIRTKSAIQSHDGGTILLIPREGGYLFRMYVDLGEIDEANASAVRQTPFEEIVQRANRILHPYAIDVRSVAWWSVYEVAHRLTDRFDDVPDAEVGRRSPCVFIVGDACHTHSAKAGQGMNVSMQDGFNIAWKLGHVLDGRATPALLDTYTVERHAVARDLIAFDRQWSRLMGARPEELDDPAEVERFFVRTFEFTTGFMTEYGPSLVTGPSAHQALATGFPVGRRFKSAEVIRVADANPVHLGHHARADGRWRIYAFADPSDAGEAPALGAFTDWLVGHPGSPLARTPAGLDVDAWFDVKVVYQERFDTIDLPRVPHVFLPRTGPLGLVDYEKVYAAGAGPDGVGDDIFEARGIARTGVVVVVRPDGYVAHVLALADTAVLAAFFAAILPNEPRPAAEATGRALV